MTTLLENREPGAARALSPTKPSLAGMTKPELMAALASAGVAPIQSKMRAAQLWNWIYARGAHDFAELTNIAKGLRAELDARFTLARPEIAAEQISEDGTRKWLLRLEPQHPGRAGAGNRDRIHSRAGPGHAVHLKPSRLHAHLHLLSYRHPAARAQSDGRRNSRANPGRARPHRRLAGRQRARRTGMASRTPSARSPTSC